MRYITILLFLTFISCKTDKKTHLNSETETEEELVSDNGIDQSVNEMWNDFTASHPEYEKEELPETDFFDTSEEEAHRYSDLIVNGKKKASSGLYIWYKAANVDLPKIGTKLIVTDFNGKAQAIIETRKIDTIPFNQITKEYAALDMGTNIQALEKWKKAHGDFFASALEQNGQESLDEMLVVCEWFETIWTGRR